MKLSKLSKRVSSLALAGVMMLSLAIPAFADSTTTTIKVMAAASTRYTLGDGVSGAYPSGTLLQEFEASHPNIKVNVTYDSSGNLVNQMVADSTRSADVFISADLARMNLAVTDGIIEADTTSNLLNNRLVLVARTDSGLTANNPGYSGALAWLQAASGRTIALGDPAVVPAGTYTQQVFGPTAWTTLTTSTPSLSTLYSNVTNVLTAVANSNTTHQNQIGSVYATDAKTNNNLIVLDSKDVNIIYPIGITNAAMGDDSRASAAQELDTFLYADLAKSGTIPVINGGSVFLNAGFTAATN